MSRALAARALAASLALAIAAPSVLEGSGQHQNVAKSPIFPALVARIGDPKLSPVEMPIGEGIVFKVEGIDEKGLLLRRKGSDPASEPPLRREWDHIPSDTLLALYGAVPSTRDSVLAYYDAATDLGFPEDAAERLREYIDKDPTVKPLADARIAARLGKDVPPGGFVYFREAFVTPAEREKALADLADAWLAEKKMATAAKAEDAESLFKRALHYLGRGHYELGVKVMKKAATAGRGQPVGDRAAERARENDFVAYTTLYETGDSRNRADFVIAGDGYVLEDRPQRAFDRAADQLARYFLAREVFREYRGYVNFHRVNAWSKEDGVDSPTTDASTALGGKWSEAAQGQVTVDHALVARMMERFAPAWECALVMVKRGSLGTGGGRVAAFGHAATGVAYHEFGHAYAGLLDEYSTQTSKEPPVGPAPIGVNVTNTDDPAKAPWKHWLDAKAPGIGVFPGGAGRARGAWHPSELGCVMESGSEFCPVCREHVVLTLYSHARPVDEFWPKETDVVLPAQGKLDFKVRVLRPASRPLSVKFTFNGKPLDGQAKRETVAPEPGSESMREDVSFTLDPAVIAIVPGYSNTIEAVVKDETPWVIRDPEGRLTQKVRWNVRGAGEAKKE